MNSGAGVSTRIVTFVCQESGWRAIREAMSAGTTFENVRFLPVPCSGRVDVLHILKAFEEGADGVMVLACFKDSCRYVAGNYVAERKVAYVKTVLREIGIEPERVKILFGSPASPGRLVREIMRAESEIAALGALRSPAGVAKEVGTDA